MNIFRFDRHPVVFLRPRISHPYAWAGHIPFAYLLVDLLRPRRLVELGTDSGNSYLAFCQAISHLDAATEATAVDSWEGDPHARFYGEAVYAALSAYHNPRYGKFSRLMRGFFDDAVKTFEDDSIDLLHIDGLHTYEAVKHDFQTWLPKLSERAVVIFHDSHVRERGFGVWKFIDELRSTYRCFDFKHSNGLAVVEVGKDTPKAFRDFMTHALADAEAVQAYFEGIAATIVDEKSGSPAQVGAERRDVECRVYYRNDGQTYDESRSITIRAGIEGGPADLSFELPAGVRPDFVRLDPADVPCVFGLRHLTISSADAKDRVLIKDEPARIRAISGELLPARPPAWTRMMTFDSDPFIEVFVEDIWAKFDKSSPMIVEFGVEYEFVLSDPELIPLAHSGALSLREFRSNGLQQWGYPAIHSQVIALNEHLRALAQHVDALTKNQTSSLQSLVDRTDDLSHRFDRASEGQVESNEALGKYVSVLAQHLDHLTRGQGSSMQSFVERMDDLSRRLDRASEGQIESNEALGKYVSVLAQHLDQLTRGQGSSMQSFVERMDDLSGRVDRAGEKHADSSAALGQYVSQLAQHLDQLTRNQILAIDMQRAADSRAEVVDLNARLEEIIRIQSRVSEKVDELSGQGLIPRLKRLFGR